MKSIMKCYLTGFMSIVVFASIGCQKSDTLDTVPGITKVKVFDDTLASEKGDKGRIVSATDRIYMTYGLGTLDTWGAGYAENPAIPKLNALDNNCNLLWQKTLPTNISIKAILAMDDGGCLLAGVNVLEILVQNLYFYRYDRNGNEILSDSVPFPSAGSDNYLFDFGLMRSANGNILVYGNFWEFGYAARTFASEYDLNLNLQWNQVYQSNTETYMSGCTIAPDGGYLFVGYKGDFVGPIYFSSLFLVKTNASGDTLWTKLFAPQERLYSNDLVALANGNYCLTYTYSINSGNQDNGIQQTHIMELNGEGDSLNSARIDMGSQIFNSGPHDIRNYIHNSALVPLANGGVYALMNSGSSGGGSKQNNTSTVILNASLTSNSGGFFQLQTNEYFGAACKTSDGRIACSGLIQPLGKSYYKPALLIDKQ